MTQPRPGTVLLVVLLTAASLAFTARRGMGEPHLPCLFPEPRPGGQSGEPDVPPVSSYETHQDLGLVSWLHIQLVSSFGVLRYAAAVNEKWLRNEAFEPTEPSTQ